MVISWNLKIIIDHKIFLYDIIDSYLGEKYGELSEQFCLKLSGCMRAYYFLNLLDLYASLPSWAATQGVWLVGWGHMCTPVRWQDSMPYLCNVISHFSTQVYLALFTFSSVYISKEKKRNFPDSITLFSISSLYIVHLSAITISITFCYLCNIYIFFL